jgi:hypothetical protein
MTYVYEPVQLYRGLLPDFLYAPEMIHLAGAALAAIPIGYGLSWALDKAFLKRAVDDRIAGIAMASGLSFVLMMAGATALLTWGIGSNPFRSGPIMLPPIGFAIAFIIGLAAVGTIRMILFGREYEQGEEELVFDHDIYDQSQYDEEVTAWDEKNKGRNYLSRHWAGHLPLPVSYWINGALLSALVLAIVEYLTGRLADEGGSLRGIAIVILAYLIFSGLLWVWSSVGIWRSAYWHRRRGGTPGWGLAARIMVVLSLAVTLYRAGDLALQAAELGTLARGRDSIGEIARMEVSKDGSELVVSGNLANGAAARFQELLERSPKVRTIVLSSPGGRLLEAKRIAALIRKRGLDTRVADLCSSACTNVLLAGRIRTAPEEARIGFHQPSFPGMNEWELRDGIEETRSEYLAAGVDPNFVARAMVTPAQSMWFPTPEQLVEARVITGSGLMVAGPDGKLRPETAAQMRVRRNLAATAARLNARAPVRLNELTTVERASASGMRLTQHLRIGINDIEVGGARAQLTRELRQQLCSDVETNLAIREGGSFAFSYSDGRGRHLLEVVIDRCSA